MTAKQPSDKFGVWREPDGGLRLEFYRPDGLLTSRVLFDAEAAREFLSAVAGVDKGRCTCPLDICDPGCDVCGELEPFADCVRDAT